MDKTLEIIYNDYQNLLKKATELCLQYVKEITGRSYGYNVYDLRICKDYIYFKSKHYDGVCFAVPEESLPTCFLEDSDWKTKAKELWDSRVKINNRYFELSKKYEEKYLVPEFVVKEYLEKENENDKKERLEYLKLKHERVSNTGYFISNGSLNTFYQWEKE